MDQLEKLLENPFVRLLAAFGLLTALLTPVRGVLSGLTQITGLFDRLGGFWNLSYLGWLGIFIVLGAWIGFGMWAKFDPVLIYGAGGAFFVWFAFVRNIVVELPNFFGDLLVLLNAFITFAGLALGFLMLTKINKPMDLSPATFGMAGTPGQAPAQPGAAPAQPAAAATQTPGAPEPGWFADPKGEAELRWWDGATWTDNTN